MNNKNLYSEKNNNSNNIIVLDIHEANVKIIPTYIYPKTFVKYYIKKKMYPKTRTQHTS